MTLGMKYCFVHLHSQHHGANKGCLQKRQMIEVEIFSLLTLFSPTRAYSEGRITEVFEVLCGVEKIEVSLSQLYNLKSLLIKLTNRRLLRAK